MYSFTLKHSVYLWRFLVLCERRRSMLSYYCTHHASSPWPTLQHLFSLTIPRIHYKKKTQQAHIKSQKSFLNENKHMYRDGTLKNQPDYRWEWHHNNFTPSLHLVPFCQLCFVFVSCVHRAVEGSGMGSTGCVVNVDMHGEWYLSSDMFTTQFNYVHKCQQLYTMS